ncbi:MAG: DNA primase [Chloroflexota bacterium]|mgnify:CR=1 FL=1
MSTIDDIKQRLDIVDVISQFVPNIQKAGRNFRALCPFHAEKHASFYIFPEKQSWYCFGGCHSGGDVFSFIMKKDNLAFAEALHLLAARAGVELAPTEKEEDKESQRLYSLNEAARHFYHHQLLEAKEAGLARDYLKKRGIFPDSVVLFDLGYSPATGQALRNHLFGQGWGEDELLRAGLIVRMERNESRDLFHHRLLFPIRNAQGKIAGFGGRTLDEASPRYLNSPASPVFNKNSLLYGLYEAKEAIRKEDQTILVEGYIDVVIAHQHGFKNVVATMGTALTEKQFLSLKKLCHNFILALDADPAGLHATLRGVEVAVRSLEERVQPIPDWRGLISYENVLDAEIKVLSLPQGTDPDELILKDPQAWPRLCAEAMPVMDFFIEALSTQRDLSRVEEKRELVHQLQPFFHQIKDPIRWAHYVQKLGRRLQMDERWLTTTLKPGRGPAVKQAPPLPSSQPLEEYCLSMLLHYPELKPIYTEGTEAYFLQTQNRALFQAWYEAPDLPSLNLALEPYLREHLELLINRRLPPLNAKEREVALNYCLLRLKENFLRWQLQVQAETLSQTGSEGPSDFPDLDEQLKQVLLQQSQKGD